MPSVQLYLDRYSLNLLFFMISFFHLLWLIILLSIVVCGLWVCRTYFKDLLAFRISTKKSDIILVGSLVYFTCSFSFENFNILSLIYVFSVLIVLCGGEFIFQTCLFSVTCLLYLVVSSFFLSGIISSIIVLKNFLCLCPGFLLLPGFLLSLDFVLA